MFEEDISLPTFDDDWLLNLLFVSENAQATADEWLQKLETSVQALKDEAYGDSEHPETLLDDMADSQDSLQKAVVILDPR